MGKARRTRDTILPVGIIYKISSADGALVYYGATDNFSKRMREHKNDYKRYLNGKFCYLTAFDIIKLRNYKTEIFQTHKNIKWGALLDIETDIIFNNSCVNKQSKKDSKNSDYISPCLINNPNYKSPCLINNPNYFNDYKMKNAATINEQFICCDCPGRYTHKNKSQHFKSQKHIKALKLKLEQQENLLKQQAEQITEIKTEVKKIKLKMKTQPPQQITNNNININNAGDTPTTNINNN